MGGAARSQTARPSRLGGGAVEITKNASVISTVEGGPWPNVSPPFLSKPKIEMT